MTVRMLRQNSQLRHKARMLAARMNSAVTSAMRSRWKSPAADGVAALRRYLEEQYLPSWYEGVDMQAFLLSPEGQADLRLHLTDRLELDRYQFVPWISSVLSLDGARVLEVGCGTGSACTALAEQGAAVTGFDVHVQAIEATRLRCEAYGVPCRTVVGNAEDLAKYFEPGSLDLIVFFAVLEHMTLEERKASLTAAWDLLRPGQFLCITDTPNRLWPYDSHTARLPFFHWLPDELAFEYSARSPRAPFNARFRELSDHAMLTFRRQGRGVSYHEVELALNQLEIVSDQAAFLMARNPVRLVKHIVANDMGRERWLNRSMPKLQRAWFSQNLNVITRKPEPAQ
jgi:S-adenosylmethionine-dependent methyltransferase